MIAWPAAAARAAGADPVVVVDSAARRLDGAVAGVEFAIQREPLGTADAVKAARPFMPADGTVVVMNGDHPLITQDTIESLVDALTSLIEPLLIVFMGIIVGGMVICLYLPMFDIINAIKQ